MPQLAVAAIGSYIGSVAISGTVMGMTGAAIGWSVGSLVGSMLFAPDGPKANLQDTRAAKLQFGAKMPRVYGRARMPLNPRWQSEWRPTAQSAGGKGGGGGSEYYTYSADGLFWVADGTNIVAITRLWHNGKLVWTLLDDSPEDSIDASLATDLFSAITFHDGNPSQMPWPVYEAAVGTANADAHRRIACVSIENYQAGQSPNWGMLEVEVMTEAALAVPPEPLTILQSDFIGGTDDISCYQRGPATINPVALNSVSGGSVNINNNTSAPPTYYLTYGGITHGDATFPGGRPITVEFYATHVQSGNVSGSIFINYWHPTSVRMIGVTGDNGALWYNDSGFGAEYTGPPGEAFGRHHYAMVFDENGFRFYFDGDLRYATGGNQRGAGGGTTMNIGGSGYTSLPAFIFSLEAFRIRWESVYTGSSFTPPATIPYPEPCVGNSWVPGAADLREIMDAEMLRSGLLLSQFDNSALAGIPVTGVVFSGSARESCEHLAAAFYFGATCSDRLYTRRRGTASVATIPFAHTGAANGDSPGEPFAGVARGSDLEVPAYWTFSSPRLTLNYETGTITSDRMVTSSVEIREVMSPVVFSASEQKGRAAAFAVDARVAAHSAEVLVDDVYAALEPCDVFTAIDEEGNSYRLRAVNESYAQNAKKLSCVLDDVQALPTSLVTADPYTPTLIVASPGEVSGVLLDAPLLRDVDDDHGFYWVTDLDGASSASLFRSTDDVSFDVPAALVSTSDAITGLANTTLGAWARPGLRDLQNSVRVTVSGPLASTTDEAMIADESVNAFALGAPGRWEYAQFRTATLVDSGPDFYTYDLTGLFRGERGTEAHIGTHASGDTFILLRLTGLRRYEGESGEVGLLRYWKHVAAGRLASSVTSEPFTNSAVGRRPFSPVHLSVDRDSSNNATINWTRRTRLSTRFASASGISAPLGEASEAYEVEVFASGAYAAVLRTIAVTSPSASYSAAQQTADGLTPGNALFLRVYQLSETVGRGAVLEATA